jgi:hypothetical protein
MIKIAFAIALLTPLVFLLAAISEAAAVNLRSMLASPVDLTIYSADRKLVIGHAHFTIKEEGKKVEIIGDTRYLNGERDLEHVSLQYEPGDPLPVTTALRSSFLAADGSPQLMETVNFESGEASCRWGGELGGGDYEERLESEPDTYAGAASIIPLEYALKKGESSVRFHVFDCAPKPTIFTVDAKLENGEVRWNYYPGELAKMGLTPDLGWLNVVASPFIPNITVWFDPKQDYQYVGAFKSRFYRGREQVLVRAHAPAVKPANHNGQSNSPEGAAKVAD